MPIGKTSAVVIGGFPLGESDRVVSFFTRDFGKVRGVAKAARRARSRFGAALELFTLGTLVFFDGGRSDLVSVDHFDITRAFGGVRDDLDRLGHAAWMAECVARLTAERDPHAAVYGLLVRALRSLEGGAPPSRVVLAFGVRCVEALGHGLRTDACVACRTPRAARPWTAIDLEDGGVVCPSCVRGGHGLTAVGPRAVEALARLKTMAWGEAVVARLGRAEGELRDVLDGQIARLAGAPARVPKFLREVGSAFRATGERA
jgi:DNA repair protein RecO (recombination protein O)